ncbi:type II secretion system protein [bacterium]|nr:type II secretion system protein [bacterium]
MTEEQKVNSRVDFSLPEKRDCQFAGRRKTAFTLAEVLITLGVIGIVAAMTLPPLVSNYRKKALQTALLKTYSELQQVNQQLISEGNNLRDIDTYSGNEVRLRAKLIMGKFNGKYALTHADYPTIRQELEEIYHNKGLFDHSRKNLGAHPTCDNGGVWTDNQGRLWLFNDADKQICVDINGTKGPNAYGYDYFIFYPDANGKIIPHYTDIENEFSLSYYDYTYYAVTDQHPTEKGKTYWKDYLKY